MKDRKKVIIIREKLEKIVKNNYKEEDVQELLSCLYEILFSIVKNVRTKAIENGGYGKEDLISIALSSLFESDRKGDYTTLKKLFSPFVCSNCSIEEFSRFLHSTLLKRIKEALTKLLNEVYPFQTKLRISFFYFLKNSKELKFEKRGNDFIIWHNDLPQPSLPPLSYGTVLSESVSSMLWNKKPSNFLVELMKVLKSKNIDNPVYLRDIVDVYVALNPIGSLDESIKSFNFLDARSTEELIEGLLKKVEEDNWELVDLYVKKKRISESQKEAFIKAVNDILYDWLHAGKEGSFYHYLASYTNEIDISTYRKDKRKILEYLVKRSRKLIREAVLGIFNGNK